jgi:hypothetical protein
MRISSADALEQPAKAAPLYKVAMRVAWPLQQFRMERYFPTAT